MKLGIVYKNGEPINHRSLIKIILNPLLRYFGLCIATIFYNRKIGSVKFVKCDRQKIRWSKYQDDYDFIIKKRVIL